MNPSRRQVDPRGAAARPRIASRWPRAAAAALTAGTLTSGTLTSGTLASAGSASATERPATREPVAAMRIRLSFQGEPAIEAALLDVPAARDLAAMLPLTLVLRDYAATEKIGDLPRRLTTAGAPDGFEPEAGDIAFYAPWGNLAIFHRGFRYAPGLVRLGAILAGTERFAAPGPVSVTVERAD